MSRHRICCNQFLMLFCFRNYRDINFFIGTSIFAFSTYTLLRHSFCCSSATLSRQCFLMSRQDFFWLLNNLCCDEVFFCCDRIFFSGPYHWLSCLLRHRNLCCDRLDLANLNSLSISVATKFSSIATECYHSLAFFCRDRKLLCRDRDSAFNSSLCHNMNFFVTIPLVLLFKFLSGKSSPQPHVLFVTTELIFVATNSCCSLLRTLNVMLR